MGMRVLPLGILFSFFLLACSNANVTIKGVKTPSTGTNVTTASGINPVNTDTVGGYSGLTYVGSTPSNYLVQVKVGGKAINPATLTNAGTGHYRVATKVVAP